MKYKVGDKVRVRSDLDVSSKYYMEDGSNWEVAVGSMIALAGKVVTIKEAVLNRYYIKEEQCRWTDEMFEGLVETPKFKIGDKVRIKPSCKVDEKYGGIQLLDAMYFKDVRTIKNVDYPIIELEEDEYNFAYSPQMFELVEEEPKKAPVLEVGMKVKLRKDLYWENTYGVACTYSMSAHAGEIVTIAKIKNTIKGIVTFCISEEFEDCDKNWLWSSDMLELIEEDPFEEFKEVVDYVLFDSSFPIPTKPIVVIPVVSDSFTKAWMESFVKRNGGMAVENH